MAKYINAEQATDMYYISMWNTAVIEEGKTGKPSADRLIKRFQDNIQKLPCKEFVNAIVGSAEPTDNNEEKKNTVIFPQEAKDSVE
jgi:hypothetical protein